MAATVVVVVVVVVVTVVVTVVVEVDTRLYVSWCDPETVLVCVCDGRLSPVWGPSRDLVSPTGPLRTTAGSH